MARWLKKEGFGLYFSDKSKTNTAEQVIVRLTKKNTIVVYDEIDSVKRYILNSKQISGGASHEGSWCFDDSFPTGVDYHILRNI